MAVAAPAVAVRDARGAQFLAGGMAGAVLVDFMGDYQAELEIG